ncbi:hypothetical protein LEN26_020925 [Aphanomyces euteiches]|nr:hypothetical protein LEN26_020925 [Aphanomyces euteiches]KAH9107589.1 hypothetical protein AeMF1_017111 [Aphanomyces euteiches]
MDDVDRMRQLACIATAVMDPVLRSEDRRSPTTPADFYRATFPRIEPPPRTTQPTLPHFHSLVGDSLPSLVHHEKHAQYNHWKAQEQELMRRQRHVIALKEKQQAARYRASRKGPPQHRLQELLTQHRLQELLTQQRQQDALRSNLVQINYHRILAEEGQLRREDDKPRRSDPSPLEEERGVLTTPLAQYHASEPLDQDQSECHANAILKLMLPPVVSHRLNVKDVSLNELRPHFNKPMAAVAKELGVCITLMKKICRKNGLSRWPHRRIRSLVNRITSLQVVAESVDAAERSRFDVHITNLRKELSDVIQNPNGKSRKAQDYERRKVDSNSSSGNGGGGGGDGSSSQDDDVDEEELCCFENLEAGARPLSSVES